MPERTIHFDMDLTHGEGNTSPRLASLIKECVNFDTTDSPTGKICEICDQRIIELAIRQEHALLIDVLTFITTSPEEDTSNADRTHH